MLSGEAALNVFITKEAAEIGQRETAAENYEKLMKGVKEGRSTNRNAILKLVQNSSNE